MPTPALSTPWVPLWPLSPAKVDAMTLLADVTIGSPTNIGVNMAVPQNYKALKVIVTGRSLSAAADNLAVQFNGDGGANYDTEFDTSIGATPQSGESLANNYGIVGALPGTTHGADGAGTWEIDIPHYTSIFHKTAISHGHHIEALTTGKLFSRRFSARWRNVAPVTNLLIATGAGQFVAGSRITVYGLGDTIITPPGVYTLPTYGTTLPAGPADGQEAVLVDSVAAPTYQWRFRYNAGSASAFKWEFIGGTPMRAANAGKTTINTGGGPADDNNNVSLTTPRAGNYLMQYTCHFEKQSAVDSGGWGPSLMVAGVDVPDTFGQIYDLANWLTNWQHIEYQADIIAAQVIKGRIRCAGNAATSNKMLLLTPIRVS